MGGANINEPARGTLNYESLKQKGELNSYTTTLHLINSAIVKLSKLTKVTKVFRGISGRVLPKAFCEANELGVKGGIECAFTSTTVDREVAFDYAKKQRGGAGIVFEIQQGMVDRGADLSWLSQVANLSNRVAAMHA